MPADEIIDIPVSSLDEPLLPLRPVLKNSIEYRERRDSIERRGILFPILVRPSPRSPGRYEIIDGLWRFTAAVDLGHNTITCKVKHGLSDTDVLALQIEANEVTKSTTPTEVARHLHRMMARIPGCTTGQLARLISKNPSYVKDRLDLLKLDPQVQLMVDRGEIPAKSAYMLANIPARWRADHVDNARTMTVKEFCALAGGIIKQFSECVQQGRMDERYLPEFKPQPYLRGIKEIKSEYEQSQVGALIMAAENCKSLMDAWKSALRWALNLDAEAVEAQRQRVQARQHKDILARLENSHDISPE